MCGWTGHIQDSEAELLPAAETSEAELGQRSAFCKPAATGAAKAGNRNHQGEEFLTCACRQKLVHPKACQTTRSSARQNGRLQKNKKPERHVFPSFLENFLEKSALGELGSAAGSLEAVLVFIEFVFHLIIVLFLQILSS